MDSDVAARGPPASLRDFRLLAVRSTPVVQLDEGAQLIPADQYAVVRPLSASRRGRLKAAAAIGGGLACLALATGGTGLLKAKDLVFSQKFAKERVAKLWDQCGGATWEGPTTCASGSRCKVKNKFYSQCVLGAGDDDDGVNSTSVSTTTTTTIVVQDTSIQKLGKPGHEQLNASHKEDGPSLFCWCVSQITGYEVDLVQKQYQLGVGIFSCQGWRVFSIEPLVLGGEVNSTAISGVWATWNPDSYGTKLLNTHVFMKAWDKIAEGNLHAPHDWVVKVDVDAVFLADRLQKILGQESWSWASKWGSAVYIMNCAKYESMQGPLEIITRAGVDQLLDGFATCRSSIPTTDKGEDQFLNQCMKLLGLQGVVGYDFLSDFYCDGMDAACDCASGNHMSSTFHPCKSEEAFFKCAEVVRGFDKDVGLQ